MMTRWAMFWLEVDSLGQRSVRLLQAFYTSTHHRPYKIFVLGSESTSGALAKSFLACRLALTQQTTAFVPLDMQHTGAVMPEGTKYLVTCATRVP